MSRLKSYYNNVSKINPQRGSQCKWVLAGSHTSPSLGCSLLQHAEQGLQAGVGRCVVRARYTGDLQ